MVRTSDEVAMMLLAGKVADLEAESAQLELAVGQTTRGRSELRAAPENVREAAKVGEHRDLWKTIVLVRFDLAARAEMVHYLFLDVGDSFLGYLDDPEALPGSVRSHADFLNDSRPHLIEHAVLFELCKAAIQLPAYFAFKYTLVRDEPVAMSTGKNTAQAQQSSRRRNRQKYGGRVIYKHVSALRVLGATTRTARRFTAPAFKVEVEGFWRELGPGRKGKGPGDEPVDARTWVRGHLRWRDLPERPIEVLVKSRLAIARATIEAEDLLRRVGLTPTEAAPAATEPEPTSVVSREEAYRQRSLLTARLRWKILQRDDFRCLLCGVDAALDKSVRLDVDHILAIARGGKTIPENLRTLCSRCNNGKGDLLA